MKSMFLFAFGLATGIFGLVQSDIGHWRVAIVLLVVAVICLVMAFILECQFNYLIDVLSETAEKFRSTEDKKERAQLIIKLDEQLLSNFPRGVDEKTKQRVLSLTAYSANEARLALKKEDSGSLDMLLVHRDDRPGDKNDLEKLVDSLTRTI